MDLKKFEQAQFSYRHKEVPVPQLAEFFDEGEEPVWTVRNLTGAELGWLDEESTRQKDLLGLAAAFDGGDVQKAVREYFCLDDKSDTKTFHRQVSIVALGSVNPELGENNRMVAVKLAEHHPGIFRMLVNEIQALTGQGSELGKPKGSGQSRKPANGSSSAKTPES